MLLRNQENIDMIFPNFICIYFADFWECLSLLWVCEKGESNYTLTHRRKAHNSWTWLIRMRENVKFIFYLFIFFQGKMVYFFIFYFFFIFLLLFIFTYKVWFISPPCPHPLPYHPLCPLPLPPLNTQQKLFCPYL
jgi:hypothetical protein